MTSGLREHLGKPIKIAVIGNLYFLPLVLHKAYNDYKGKRRIEIFIDISSHNPLKSRSKTLKVMQDLIVVDVDAETKLYEVDEIYIQQGYKNAKELNSLLLENHITSDVHFVELSQEDEKGIMGLSKTKIYNGVTGAHIPSVTLGTMEEFLAVMNSKNGHADLVTERINIENEADYLNLISIAKMLKHSGFRNCTNNVSAYTYKTLTELQIKELYVDRNRKNKSGGSVEIQLHYKNLPPKEIIVFTSILKSLDCFSKEV